MVASIADHRERGSVRVRVARAPATYVHSAFHKPCSCCNCTGSCPRAVGTAIRSSLLPPIPRTSEQERERGHASFSATTRNTKRTSSAIIEMRESRAARRLSAAASRLLKKRRKRARGGGRLAIALRCFFLRLFLSRSFIRLLLLSLSLLLLSRSFVRCCCPSRCCCCSLVHSLAAAVPLAAVVALSFVHSLGVARCCRYRG